MQSGLPITFRSGARAGLTDALLLGTAAGSQRPDLIVDRSIFNSPLTPEKRLETR